MKKGFTMGVTEVGYQHLLKMLLCVLRLYEQWGTNLEGLKEEYLTTGFFLLIAQGVFKM